MIIEHGGQASKQAGYDSRPIDGDGKQKRVSPAFCLFFPMSRFPIYLSLLLPLCSIDDCVRFFSEL